MAIPKIWLYRGLAVIVAILMVASFTMPWWTLMLDGSSLTMINIYGYGLRHTFDQLSLYYLYLVDDITPLFQTVLAWIYISANIGFILLGAYIKDNKGRWLLGIAGSGYFAYILVAIFVVVSNRIADINIALQSKGTSFFDDIAIGYFSSLQFGYYLALVAAVSCMLLALMRPLILGRTRSEV